MPKQKYDIPRLLASVAGYKGLPYPGAVFAAGSAADREQMTKFGTRLRRQDQRGIWYFMPVYFRHKSLSGKGQARQDAQNNLMEFPNAIISVTGKKTIVETAMIGRMGSVKELIGLDDYEVSIAAFLQSQDGTYPDNEITQLRGLYEVNESVEMISALTDLIFTKDDKVVIKSIEFPSVPGVEDGVAVRMKCVTDKAFNLILDKNRKDADTQ